MLEEPNIQVFERSSKQEQVKEADTATQAQASVTEPHSEETSVKAASEAKSFLARSRSLEVTTAESRPTPSEKLDLEPQPSSSKPESKPKKIGKFNVDIR